MDARVLHEIVAERLEMDPMAPRVAKAKLDRRSRIFALEQIGECSTRTGDILRMDRVERKAADQGARRITEYPCCRRRFVQREPLPVVNSNDVLRVLDESAESFVVYMQRVVAAPGLSTAIRTRCTSVGFGEGLLVEDHEQVSPIEYGEHRVQSF